MAKKITVINYILERLVQIGVAEIYGVPGDFNLRALDDIEDDPRVEWIGCANELNASYAADGAARVSGGLAVLLTTFGVGELSATNGIAGAYSERVPVLHIVGAPSTKLQDRHAILHHTLGSGYRYNAYAEISKHITSDQFVLTKAEQVHEFVDQAIIRALSKARPTYLTLPTDLVTMEISAEPLDTPLVLADIIAQPSFEPASEGTLDHAVKAIVDLYQKAERPVIIVDACVIRFGVQRETQQLIETTGLPFFSTPMGKGAIDEDHPQFVGAYIGAISTPEIREQVDGSDLVILVGSLKSDFNSGGFSYKVSEAHSVELHSDRTYVQYAHYDGLGFRRALPALTKALGRHKQAKEIKKRADAAGDVSDSTKGSNDEIKQDHYWPHLGTYLKDGDVILAETGTSLFGILDVKFKKNTTLVGQVLYGSIGYTGGAVLGASIAAKKSGRRVILCIGDGSLQLTVQEIGTLIRHGLSPIILLINNSGYVIERQIHGPNRVYNDIATWRWQEMLNFFGANPETSASYLVKTNAEFDALWQKPDFADGKKLSVVEIIMDPHDAPRPLREQAAMTEKVNSS